MDKIRKFGFFPSFACNKAAQVSSQDVSIAKIIIFYIIFYPLIKELALRQLAEGYPAFGGVVNTIILLAFFQILDKIKISWPYRLVVRTSGFHPENRDSTSRGAVMHPKYLTVIKLRKKGKSYREIAKIVDVSKNSVSQWCRNLKLPLSARKILEQKTQYPKELFAKYNQLKAQRVQMIYELIVAKSFFRLEAGLTD